MVNGRCSSGQVGWVKVIVSIASNDQWPLSSGQVGWVKVIVQCKSDSDHRVGN